VGFTAGDREAERVATVDQRARQIVGIHLPPLVVQVFQDLFQHDAPLDVDVEERRLRQHLAEERARLVEGLGRQRERENPVVYLRRREKRAPEPLEREVHRVGAPDPLRPPVDHVLEEMTDAVVVARLEARTDASPERDVGSMQPGLGDDDHAQAIGERDGMAFGDEAHRRPR
jgi:hypothetical protein